jgi:hypothetical protein
MREAEPAQPTAAHRTGSYALASGLPQPKRKQKIIGDLEHFLAQRLASRLSDCDSR